jgi:hypothetical protein
MDFILRNKIGLGAGVALILAAGAYFVLSKGGDEALLQSTGSEEITSPVSRELLVILSDLRTVTLDESLFGDEGFRSLVDFGIEIPLQPVGRRNPFAPIGSQTTSRTQATTTAR